MEEAEEREKQELAKKLAVIIMLLQKRITFPLFQAHSRKIVDRKFAK
jgi:hypothetical protein